MEWKPIETAPKDKTYVAVWYMGDHPCYEIVRPDVIWYGNRPVYSSFQDNYAHWMPLPDPPKGGE